jgi:hypothetical protein
VISIVGCEIVSNFLIPKLNVPHCILDARALSVISDIGASLEISISEELILTGDCETLAILFSP